ncbi:MAG: hypothetical protein ACTSO7_01060 [Candidatus Heimdallarchaeota archaeon]
MKPRILPIILVLLGAAGMVLFFVTPVMAVSVKIVDTSIDTNLRVSVNVYYNGSGSMTIKGTDFGIEVDDYMKIEQDSWGYTGADEYPTISVYLCAIGLGVAILGMIFSIFGGNSALRILGAILGLAGAAACITGCFLMWNFYVAWKADADTIVELFELLYGAENVSSYNNFSVGWLVPVISMGLVALGSVFLLVVKPKEIY